MVTLLSRSYWSNGSYWSNPQFLIFWHLGTLALSPECQSARMPESEKCGNESVKHSTKEFQHTILSDLVHRVFSVLTVFNEHQEGLSTCKKSTPALSVFPRETFMYLA